MSVIVGVHQMNPAMNDYNAWLITWTTYGTWLPGDKRGWRSRKNGQQLPQPLLQKWCQEQMTGEAVLLRINDRKVVKRACLEHCEIRGWQLLAVDAEQIMYMPSL